MKRIVVLILSSIILFLSGCEPGTPDNKRGQKNENPQNQPSGNNNNSNKPDLTSSPEFTQFKNDFAAKYAGFKSLPVETLYQIIKAVPEQIPSWSCGLVQSSHARASASVLLELALNPDISQCNVEGDYPILIKIEKKTADSALLKLNQISTFLPAVGLSQDKIAKIFNQLVFEPEGDKSYFRVGALPDDLVTKYLNKKGKLPENISASLMATDTLAASTLLKAVDGTLLASMPTIALYVNDKKSLAQGLHYYSIVGYDESKDKLLVLNTTGEGIERIGAPPIDDFISHLNTEAYKSMLEPVVFLIEQGKKLGVITLQPGDILPDPSVLDTLAPYNLITFKKK